jgi:hypothetical protein
MPGDGDWTGGKHDCTKHSRELRGSLQETTGQIAYGNGQWAVHFRVNDGTWSIEIPLPISKQQ